MKRSPWIFTPLGLLAGCGGPAMNEPPPTRPPVVQRPADPETVPRATSSSSRFTGVTRRDEVFAEFLREKSGGMVRQASVALEKKGELRVELDRSATPDDTLPLTNSLMKGARKDFPDQPIMMAVYDPNGELILRARYKVGRGVTYQPAGEDKTIAAAPESRPAESPSAPAQATESDRSGTTDADRKFAEWAEDHGKSYLRYVNADLERHGRLWFGVTPEVKPADVPNLTKSLLEGAHKEFPRGELVATVFDPEGQKIGRATLARDGAIHWEH